MRANKQMNSFCRELRRRVRKYLDDGKHRKEFEEWYLEKYGKPYQWRKGELSMGVRCLCWNCGREIRDTEPIYEINEELWCEQCADPYADDKPDCDHDEESL